MTDTVTKVKAKWFTVEPGIFPADVQKAIAKAAASHKTASADKAAANKAIAPYASRIAVDGVKVLQEGHSLATGYRFDKFSVASMPKKAASASKSAAVLD